MRDLVEFTSLPHRALREYLKRNWRCEECKFWDEKECNNPKGQNLVDELDGSPYIIFEKNFGCIFWEKKDD